MPIGSRDLSPQKLRLRMLPNLISERQSTQRMRPRLECLLLGSSASRVVIAIPHPLRVHDEVCNPGPCEPFRLVGKFRKCWYFANSSPCNSRAEPSYGTATSIVQ